MKRIFAVVLLAFLTACGLLPSSPEEQIRTGANSVTSAANLTVTRLQLKKMSVAQARNYQGMLRTAGDTLNTANDDLVACRKKTGSTQKSSPDPCKGDITVDIGLATSILGQIEATLKAKE